MALIDELKKKREERVARKLEREERISDLYVEVAGYSEQLRHLDVAIAALQAADDHAYFAEQETAREQLEREPEDDSLAPEGMPACAYETVTLTEADFIAPDADEQDDASPALNEAMQDEREQPVAIAQPEWNEPQPTEGYAPVTNPAADEAAKAHDWYDPKAVHERQKFNPFGMFRREPEDA